MLDILFYYITIHNMLTPCHFIERDKKNLLGKTKPIYRTNAFHFLRIYLFSCPL